MIFPLSFSCFYIRTQRGNASKVYTRFDRTLCSLNGLKSLTLVGEAARRQRLEVGAFCFCAPEIKSYREFLNLYFWKVMFQFYHFIFFFLILFNFLNLFQFLIPFDFFSFFYLFHFFLQVLPEWFKNHAKHLRTLPVGYPKKKKWIRKWNLQNLFAEIFNVVYSKFSTGISFQDTCGKKRFPQFAFNHK